MNKTNEPQAILDLHATNPYKIYAQLSAMQAAMHVVSANPDIRMLHRVGSVLHDTPPPEGASIKIGMILDTETTGPDHLTDRLIELGMVKFEFDSNSGQIYRVLGTFNALEDPGMPISAEATAVNGITDAMVEGLRIDDAKVGEFVGDVSLVVAHSAAFDRKFVEKRFSVFETLDWGCSLEQVDWKAEGFGTAKLDYLAVKNGLFYDAHRAENDCLALLEVLRQPLPVSGIPPMKKLSDKVCERSYKVSAEKAPFEAKDLLKEHGFRWDAEARVWHITTSGSAEIKEVVDFLREEIYGGKPVSLPFEIFDAKCLFSARGGHKVRKSIIKEVEATPPLWVADVGYGCCDM